MPTLDITGAYCGVESFRAAIPSTSLINTSYDGLIYDHLCAASRDIDHATLRHFFPVTGTNKYRWPPFHVAASWEIWLEDDLLAATLVQVAASGQGASPVTLTHYLLEPQPFGPPYSRIEVDLSSSDVLQAGPTPQQSVAITGQWGYTNATQAAGTLAQSIGSSDTSLTCSDDRLIDQGDVLLIDSEAIAVVPPRSYTTSPSTTVTIVRGVNGTTAAAHSQNAPIARYRAPDNVRRLTRSTAMVSFFQDFQMFGRTMGMENQVQAPSPRLVDPMLRQQVLDAYMRRRTAAV